MTLKPRFDFKAERITAREFYNALRAIWIPGTGVGSSVPRVGIAVSGGVDSMAMAGLCSELKRSRQIQRSFKFMHFHAFIVDHGARSNSREEALEVGRELDSMKIPYSILNVRWPESGDPQKLSDFETVARKLRYVALGKACFEHNIRSLLVAHHMDDQAETVLMRMAQGHRGTGLKCMAPVSDIPECWGIHGVHKSGASEMTEKISASIMERDQSEIENCWHKWQGTSRKFRPRPADRSKESVEEEKEYSPPLKIEDGGIKVYRPFLGFEKERLMATCLALRVNWIEDETNQNPCLTPRNAIRQILKLGRLPEAIQKTSLSALATRMRNKDLNRKAHAESVFRKCDIRMLDTRVGAIIVRFPVYDFDRSVIPAMFLHQVMLSKVYQFAILLRRVIGLVTPLEHVSSESLHPAVRAIFPKLFDHAGEGTSKFTCGHVFFERVHSTLEKCKLDRRLDPEYFWILTRQPYISTTPSPLITFPATANPSESGNFVLWDGRFWICVRNQSPRPVVVRPLYPADLTLLRRVLPKKQMIYLNELLRVVAPGKTRWTLPVIAEAYEDGQTGEADQERTAVVTLPDISQQNMGGNMNKRSVNYKERKGGRVLALPTFSLDYGANGKGISWEVRYKNIDFGRHNVDALTIV